MTRTRTRWFYAIEYAYGRQQLNNGNRADTIYRFARKGERDAFVAGETREIERDVIAATHDLTRRALRYAAQGIDWPVPVITTSATPG